MSKAVLYVTGYSATILIFSVTMLASAVRSSRGAGLLAAAALSGTAFAALNLQERAFQVIGTAPGRILRHKHADRVALRVPCCLEGSQWV